MKTLQRKITKVLLCLTLILPGMFSPFTCPGFSFPIFNLLTTVKAEEDPGTTTATNTGIAALIAILMASGLRFVGDYETVVQPAITQLWSDFSSYAGNQLTLAELGAGIAITQGYMRVSSSVNNAIANFTAWYKQTFEQPVTGDVTIPVGGESTYGLVPANTCFFVCGKIGTYAYNVLINSNKELRTIGVVRSNTVYWYGVSEVFGYYGMSEGNFSPNSCNVSVGSVSFDSRYYGGSYSGHLFYFISQGLGSVERYYNGNYPLIYDNSSKNMADIAYDYTFGADASIGDISMEGQSLELKDGYQLDNDQAKLLDIAGLAALAAALGLALDNVTDLVNDIPLIYGYPWAQDFPDVYPNTPADTIPWVDTPTSVIPADVPEYVPTTPSDTDSYKVLGLERVFPFSIPFDLIALVRVLNAEPVTPSFTFKLYDPYKHRNVSQTVTLEQFSSVAAVFRVGVVLLFLAALIKLTRILIRG